MPPKNVVIFFFLHDLNFIVGQKSAMALGDTLTKERESDKTEGGCTDDDGDQVSEDSAILLAHFQDAGLIYTEEGDENWVLFLSWTLNSKIKVAEIRSDGVVINWSTSPPSDTDIISVQDITSLHAAEMSLHATMCSMFIPSPWPIS